MLCVSNVLYLITMIHDAKAKFGGRSFSYNILGCSDRVMNLVTTPLQCCFCSPFLPKVAVA